MQGDKSMAIYYDGVNVTSSESGRSKFTAGSSSVILTVGGDNNREFTKDIIIRVPSEYARVYCSFNCQVDAFDLPSNSLDKIYAECKNLEFGASNASEHRMYSINGSVIDTRNITIRVGVLLKAPLLTSQTSVAINMRYSIQEY